MRVLTTVVDFIFGRLLRSRVFWKALLLVLAVAVIVRFFDSILTVVMWTVVVGAILAAVFALVTLCVPAPEPRMIVLTQPPQTPNTDNRHKAAHIHQHDVRGTTSDTTTA